MGDPDERPLLLPCELEPRVVHHPLQLIEHGGNGGALHRAVKRLLKAGLLLDRVPP